MKNVRRGMGKGLGTGYKNLVPMDTHIHSLSAKGVKTIYKVTAVALNRKTKELVGKARTEKINVKTNSLFNGAKTKEDVKERYEAFWDINPNSKEVVKVINIDAKGEKLDRFDMEYSKPLSREKRETLLKKVMQHPDIKEYKQNLSYFYVKDLWDIDWERDIAKKYGVTEDMIKAQLKVEEQKYKAKRKTPELLSKGNTGIYYMGDGTYRVYKMKPEELFDTNKVALDKLKSRLVGTATTYEEAEKISMPYEI